MTPPATQNRNDIYSGPIFGGYTVGVVGSILLLTVVILNLGTDNEVPVSVALAALALVVVGAVLTAASYVLRHIDDHRVEHVAQDSGLYEEVRILREGKEAADRTLARVAELLDRFLAHEAVVDEQSAKARGDVANILNLLAKHDLDVPAMGRTMALLDEVMARMSQMSQRQDALSGGLRAVLDEVNKSLKWLGERLAEVERKLAVALGENVVDLETRRAIDRLNQRHQERE